MSSSNKFVHSVSYIFLPFRTTFFLNFLSKLKKDNSVCLFKSLAWEKFLTLCTFIKLWHTLYMNNNCISLKSSLIKVSDSLCHQFQRFHWRFLTGKQLVFTDRQNVLNWTSLQQKLSPDGQTRQAKLTCSQSICLVFSP